MRQNEVQGKLPAIICLRSVHGSGNLHLTHIVADPETLQWTLLDKALQKRMDTKHYVCPSKDMIPGLKDEIDPSSEAFAPPKPLKPESVTAKANTDDLQMDSDSENDENEEIPEGSLFEYNIPGILSKEEVQKLDLAHWKILVRNTLVDLEVSLSPLFGTRDTNCMFT